VGNLSIPINPSPPVEEPIFPTQPLGDDPWENFITKNREINKLFDALKK
jgi:hypothetical protein